MYLRTTKVKRANGRVDEYIRLVESYWNQGSPRHRIICNLGRKDLLQPHAEALLCLLKGEEMGAAVQAQAIGAWDWGPFLVARHLWRELGLETILDRIAPGGELPDRALALVANRLTQPTSEHGLARWLETDFVCDRGGRRWLPEWREEAERLTSSRPRVRVKDGQLKQWYRTLDRLIAIKQPVEKELFLHLRDLFHLQVDLVFYDLTSTYFEGQGAPLAAHGHSRDGKPRKRQVLVGLVMIEGWPIAHHVFAGNWRDASTLPAVLQDLQERFGLARVIFVGDRGMMTSGNLEQLREKGQGYVVGLNRRRRGDVLRYLERAKGPWLECPAERAAAEKSVAAKTRVAEGEADKVGVRIFVVESEERLSYERSQREKAMSSVEEQLEGLRRRVARGRIKTPEKIGAAAQRILARRHGYRYWDWRLEGGQFEYFEHPICLPQEKALEGKYLIQVEGCDLSALEAVQVYKELSEVERAFCQLKDVIEMRPIYHQTNRRVEAHLFVAALAFLLDRALEKKMRAAGLDLSSKEAWQVLRTVRVVEIDVGQREPQRSVTRGSGRAARILKALDIRNLNPNPVKKVAADMT
jgi:transposase